jgi:hypothetical protein
MKYEQLKEIVDNVNGTTFAGIDTITAVKLKGGKKNPMQGRVTKRTVNSNVMIFSNTDNSPYETMVKRRMEEEGKDPSIFELKPRAWGTRVGKSPFIEHKGNYYLEVIFRTSGKTTYYLDGKEIEKSDIEGLDEKEKDAAEDTSQGGISNKVIIRTFAIDSIEEVRMLGNTIS